MFSSSNLYIEVGAPTWHYLSFHLHNHSLVTFQSLRLKMLHFCKWSIEIKLFYICTYSFNLLHKNQQLASFHDAIKDMLQKIIQTVIKYTSNAYNVKYRIHQSSPSGLWTLISKDGSNTLFRLKGLPNFCVKRTVQYVYYERHITVYFIKKSNPLNLRNVLSALIHHYPWYYVIFE